MTPANPKTALAALFILAAGAGHLHAQQAPVEQFLTDEHVKNAIATALENIDKGKCEDGKPCAPATKEELANPPLGADQARGAIKAGIISGTMQWCDLAWESRNFQPFLIHHKNNEEMNPRQLALMALIHGFHQAAVRKQLEQNPCPPATKEQMSSQMPLEALEEKQ